MTKNQGYLGKFLVKDKILSSFSPIFPKNLVSFQSAVIERQVQFADVSFYQGNINWDVMATKSPATIIRAGQNLWVDPQFSRNYSEAKRVGMKRGIYWFYDSRIHPDQQANILINLLKDDFPEMEVFCDWEYDYGGSYFDLQYAVSFMQKVENALHGVKVGMYTGYYFFKDHSSSTKHFVEYEYLKDKPLWLAWYTSNPAYVQIPPPWTKMTHWQWRTPTWGLDWGVESNEIDMNWYNGTVEDFKNNYGGMIVEPPPPIGDIHMNYKFVSETNQMSLRASASDHLQGDKIASYVPGTMFYGDFLQFYPIDMEYARIGDYWLHVTEVDGVTVDGWVAIVHQGEKYGTVEVVDGNSTKVFPTVIAATIDGETKNYDARA